MLAHHLPRPVLVDIVNHLPSLKLEQQPNGDQFRIVEVVHIGILLPRCSIDLPDRASHAFAPPSRLRHRSEPHAISGQLLVVRRDQYHLMTGARQGLALFVIDTDVQGLMDRSQMDNFGSTRPRLSFGLSDHRPGQHAPLPYGWCLMRDHRGDATTNRSAAYDPERARVPSVVPAAIPKATSPQRGLLSMMPLLTSELSRKKTKSIRMAFQAGS